MHSPGIIGGELRGQPANLGSPGKMAVKTDCVKQSVCVLKEKSQDSFFTGRNVSLTSYLTITGNCQG